MSVEALTRRFRTSAPTPTRSITFDTLIAALLLLCLAPLMLVLALLIWAGDGGAPLFGQLRIGRDGRLFRCWKLRSMRIDAEARLAEHLATDPSALAEWQENHKLRRDPRITPLGDFLRRSSLDEVPQLLNVLKGEMNLVGPRPIVSAEVRRYGRYFADYCSVRPGITGLWQVSGRSQTSYRRRVALDVVYARRHSPLLDVYVLAMTLPAVLRSRGAY